MQYDSPRLCRIFLMTGPSGTLGAPVVIEQVPERQLVLISSPVQVPVAPPQVREVRPAQQREVAPRQIKSSRAQKKPAVQMPRAYDTQCPSCGKAILASILDVSGKRKCGYCRMCQESWWLAVCDQCDGFYEFPPDTRGQARFLSCECGLIHEAPQYLPDPTRYPQPFWKTLLRLFF
jgi:hypothetical protein